MYSISMFCYNRFNQKGDITMEITTTQELLEEKIFNYLSEDFLNSLKETDLDEDEKHANVILSRKRTAENAKNIANIVFKAFE